MKIELKDFDENHYASNTVYSDMVLKWHSLGDTHNMIVRGEYGDKLEITEKDKAEIEKFPLEQLLSGTEIKYSNNKYFTFLKKGYINNYSFSVAPASYAVFCCEYDSEADRCILYVPNDACLYQCDVASQITVHIEKVQTKRRLFSFSKAADNPQYSIQIPNIPGYVEGSLHYTFKGCPYRYPITRRMLGAAVTVPAFNGNPPEIEVNKNKNSGYLIMIN